MRLTVKLNSDLSARVAKAAAAAGYTSPEEFAEHVLEREAAKVEAAAGEGDSTERLKGLGYID
jgi:hypothetical protein